MITGEVRSRVDAVWNAFWTGGISNHEKNNLPDVLARWVRRDAAERERPRTAHSFCVPNADIAAQGYDLSLNRYKEAVHEDVAHRPPKEILALKKPNRSSVLACC